MRENKLRGSIFYNCSLYLVVPLHPKKKLIYHEIKHILKHLLVKKEKL